MLGCCMAARREETVPVLLRNACGALNISDISSWSSLSNPPFWVALTHLAVVRCLHDWYLPYVLCYGHDVHLPVCGELHLRPTDA